MRILKTILILILGFTIGVLSTIAGIVGGGYYVVTYYTPERVEDTVQNFSPNFSFPENLPENLMDMTILEIVQELVSISGNLDNITLTELQERIGYQIPFKLGSGQDISFLFAPVMDIPIASIPSNINLVVDSLTMDSLVTLGVLGDEDLPSMPLFADPEARFMPIMDLFSSLDSFKISDVISLYVGDYYPNPNGDYILQSGEYIDYNPEQLSHENKTRYKEGYIADEQGEFVRIEGNYVEYNEEEHSNYLRYTTTMIPNFNGDKILINEIFVPYDPYVAYHNEYPRYMLPERSSDILLSIGNAYINNVPDDDTEGMTISQTVNTLQVKDIIDTEDGSSILLALENAYIGNSVPESDPEGKTIPETVNTLQIKQVIDIYEEDVYEGEELVQLKSNNVLLSIKDAYIGNDPPEGGLTIDETINTLQIKQIIDVYEEDVYEGEELIHPKSNKVLLSLQDAYIGKNPPEGGHSLDETINTLAIEDIMEIEDQYVYDSAGQLIQDKSTAFLIAVKHAYIGNNPPEGESDLNDTIDTLKINDIINIYNGTEYIISNNGEYVADGFISYDENNPEHLGRVRFTYDSENDRYLSDDQGLWVLNFIDYDDLQHDGLTRYTIAQESSKVLRSIQNAYLSDSAPEGEMTINDTINTLVIQDIVDIYDALVYDSSGQLIQDRSALFLIAVKNAYIGNNPPESERNLNDTLDSLKISDIITIYNGTEYIISDDGEYVADGFIPYNENNPEHLGRVRFAYDSETDTYLSDDEGLWVLNFIDYDDPQHNGLTRYTRAQESSNILIALQNAYVGNNPPEGGMTINATIETLTLSDVVNIYEEDNYYPDSNGDYIMDYILYDSDNLYHEYLQRYSYNSSTYEEDPIGDYVYYYTDSFVEPTTEQKYSLNPKSSLVLIALKDSKVSEIDTDISCLTLKDIQVIYDGYEFYQNNNGDYIKDGYIAFDSNDPYHKHLQRYIYNGSEYLEDNEGNYVPNIRLGETGEETIYPRYALRTPSSKLMVSLSDTPIEEIGDKLDELTIGEMIEINSSSPKIMQFFSSSTLLTLESSVQDVQLIDVIDIYYEDIYELDSNGYFVFYGAEYVEYDEISHSGWDRYTRRIGISDDDFVYEYNEEGDYVLILGNPDIYEIFNELNPAHDGLPHYTQIGQKSSNLLIKLKDAYIYDNGAGETLVEMLDNLTVIDVLGEPDAGSLLEAISYHNPDTQDNPVLINEIEERTAVIMQEATLEDLDYWEIIDASSFDSNKWDTIKDKTIQEFLEFIINYIPTSP